MSVPSEKSTTKPVSETPEVVSDINEKLNEAPAGTSEDKDLSDNEKTLLQKVAEIGEDAVAKLKSVFADVDKEELRKSINKDTIQRSVASTLDGFNTKVQTLLAPKDEHAPDESPTAPPATEAKS